MNAIRAVRDTPGRLLMGDGMRAIVAH
jgi:hypothetical protein